MIRLRFRCVFGRAFHNDLIREEDAVSAVSTLCDNLRMVVKEEVRDNAIKAGVHGEFATLICEGEACESSLRVA